MKKTFVIGAISLAAAGAASAQGLQLYGLIDMSYGKSIPEDIAGRKADFHSGGDNGNSEGNSTSRFGLKGSTDVGSGLKANFNLQSNGITSDGSVNTPFFGRQAWFGLSGGFGEVRLGRQDSVGFQTMIDFDFNGASNGVSAGGYSAVGPWLPGRQSRSLQYISPSMGGFTAQVGFQPKGNSQDGDKSVYSFGVKYATGPLAVATTYETKRDTDRKAFWSLAGSYDLQVVKLMASYADGGKIADGGSGKGFMLGVNAPVAGFNIGAHYAKNSDDNYKATNYEVWINKEVLKNTIVYLEGGHWKNKTPNPSQAATGYALGVIYVF